ncbi:hypothetical protein BO94DRAFT_316107 [Aspergillus sclerotioniger CBS 115572]|uniref:Uncharacterized protein n=1 Tax=Aspergillus sclerotioniger CBS 115572 TaxID=1450535 RepID=A0A317X6N1_9EURO|nr:hypothetical protein BO94DRAFT_316107 [Aspergillus sclerotioniger CBS 115572]PWY93985.1 hypothetical protein BO94DRAFT_316107 [Aspergillus sclerotioniger CBS 115572]
MIRGPAESRPHPVHQRRIPATGWTARIVRKAALASISLPSSHPPIIPLAIASPRGGITKRPASRAAAEPAGELCQVGPLQCAPENHLPARLNRMSTACAPCLTNPQSHLSSRSCRIPNSNTTHHARLSPSLDLPLPSSSVWRKTHPGTYPG